MLSLLYSIVSVIIIKIIGSYTNILYTKQTNFLISSTLFYILFFGILKSLLMNKEDILFYNSTYYPLLFFIVWYSISTIIMNVLQFQSNVGIYFTQTFKDNVSRRKLRK